MARDIHFWFTTLIRGLVALLAGSAILVVPDMARTLLLLPIAVTAAIVGLAAYGVLDSTLIFISSFMVSTRLARTALRVQGVIGALVGILLLSVVFEQVRLEWFLTLAAVQAISLAGGEYVIAKHETQRVASVWNYTAAVIAGIFGCAYLIIRIGFIATLTHREISWLIYAYLVALGIAQCITAARMIYADYERPAKPLPKAA